jgi:hypothetical protein
MRRKQKQSQSDNQREKMQRKNKKTKEGGRREAHCGTGCFFVVVVVCFSLFDRIHCIFSQQKKGPKLGMMCLGNLIKNWRFS